MSLKTEFLGKIGRLRTLEDVKMEYERINKSTDANKEERLKYLLDHFLLTQKEVEYVRGCFSLEEQENKNTMLLSKMASKIKVQPLVINTLEDVEETYKNLEDLSVSDIDERKKILFDRCGLTSQERQSILDGSPVINREVDFS